METSNKNDERASQKKGLGYVCCREINKTKQDLWVVKVERMSNDPADHLRVYIYIYVCVCVCECVRVSVCVCMCLLGVAKIPRAFVFSS